MTQETKDAIKTGLIIGLLLVVGILTFKVLTRKSTSDPLTEQITILSVRHTSDSLKYQATIDSLLTIEKRLKAEVLSTNGKIVRLRASFEAEKERIKVLPPSKIVELFNSKTSHVSEIIVIDNDSSVISPIEAIRTADLLFAEGDWCFDNKFLLEQKMENLDSIIFIKEVREKADSNLIINLRRDFYDMRVVSLDQSKIIEAQNKKIRTRNWVIGSVSAVALVLGGIVLLK